MVIGTHFVISNVLYNFIERKMDIKLDFNAFAWGNVRPDLDKKAINYPHTLEGSLEFVNSCADKMINYEMSISQFSMLLGVICHFVCDYFCIYHRKKYYGKEMMVDHIAYEMLLHAKLLKLLSTGRINIRYNHSREENVELLLRSRLKKYRSYKESMTKDITYAIEAAAAVCELIIRSSLIYQNNKSVICKTESKTS